MNCQKKLEKYRKQAEQIYKKNESDKNGGIKRNALTYSNRMEWEKREKYWQDNEVTIKEQHNKQKELNDLIAKSEPELQKATQLLNYYNSWSPKIVWQYCFSNKEYQQGRAKAYQSQQDLSNLKAQAIHAKIMYDYKKDQEDLKDFLNLVNPITIEYPKRNRFLHPLLSKRLSDEIHAFKQENQLNAFIRSSSLKKEDQELFHRYHRDQSKE